MKIKEYLTESKLDIGDYIKQEGSDYISYGEITQKLKNGSFKAIVFTSYDGKVTGKAKITSLTGWYPEPIKIKKESIPDKIISKIEARK
jgi:hypothetical protein